MDYVLEMLIWGVRTVLSVGLMIGFIAFIHEFGHYFCAKLVGVRVDEFSLGFGKLLWGKRIGETDYSLRLLPFIAYVRPAGMDPEEEYEPGDDPGERSFQAKGFWAKQLILVGGPVFNFLATMAILTGLFWISGVPRQTIQVGRLLEDGAAAEAGFRPGDVLREFDGQPIDDYDEAIAYIEARAGQEMVVVVDRPIVPEEGAAPAEGEAAEEGDAAEEPRFETLTLPVVPRLTAAGGKIGIEAGRYPLSGPRRRLPFGQALQRATLTTVDYVGKLYAMTVGVFVKAFGNLEVPAQVGGPVKIIAVISEQSESGLENLLFLTASISLSIGVFNLMPIPALDGGRMLLLVLTLLATGFGHLIGRKDLAEGTVARRLEESFHVVGFLFLIFVMVVVTFKDVRELVFGPEVPPSPAAEAPRTAGDGDAAAPSPPERDPSP